MKKNTLLILVTISISAMLFGCGGEPKAEPDNISSNDIVEETTLEITPEISTETPTESVTTEEVTEQETTEEETVADKGNNYTYDFEGKYWVNYSEYSNSGYFFDGTTVTCAVGDYGKEEYSYSVDDCWIDISGETYYFEMTDGKLGLCYAMGDGEDMEYYEEVDKAEFEKLFN